MESYIWWRWLLKQRNKLLSNIRACVWGKVTKVLVTMLVRNDFQQLCGKQKRILWPLGSEKRRQSNSPSEGQVKEETALYKASRASPTIHSPWRHQMQWQPKRYYCTLNVTRTQKLSYKMNSIHKNLYTKSKTKWSAFYTESVQHISYTDTEYKLVNIYCKTLRTPGANYKNFIGELMTELISKNVL